MKIETLVNRVVVVLAYIFGLLSPYVVIISSILSTINFYSVSNSIVYGVLGFFVGGTLATITMVVVVFILVGIGYYTGKGEVSGY